MTKKRSKIPSLTEKKLLQECSSTCAFCQERDVETFEYHHIDEEPSNNALENLIVVCSSCHTRITRGIYSPADVVTRKRELMYSKPKIKKSSKNAALQGDVNVSINASKFVGDIAQNITKIKTSRAPKIMHPPGSLGANLSMKAYIDYLLSQYYKFKEADKSYGWQRPFSHAAIHKSIQSRLGGKTFFLPEYRFFVLSAFLKDNIDGTIQGKRNTAQGIPNYHSFEKHCEMHKLS